MFEASRKFRRLCAKQGHRWKHIPCNFADREVLGAEATADYCYSHQDFCMDRRSPSPVWYCGDCGQRGEENHD